MPGTVKCSEGSNIVETSVDLREFVARGDRVRFGSCPMIFVVKEDKTAVFDDKSFVVDRKWLEPTADAALVFRLEKLTGVGKIKDSLVRHPCCYYCCSCSCCCRCLRC